MSNSCLDRSSSHHEISLFFSFFRLGISRIVNAIKPTIRNLIYSNLNDNEKQVFLTKSAGTSLTGLEPDLCTVIDNIIKVDESGKPKMCSMEDMDELFEQIQAKKT